MNATKMREEGELEEEVLGKRYSSSNSDDRSSLKKKKLDHSPRESYKREENGSRRHYDEDRDRRSESDRYRKDDRDRDRDRERERDREDVRHRDRERDKARDKDRDRGKDRERERARDKGDSRREHRDRDGNIDKYDRRERGSSRERQSDRSQDRKASERHSDVRQTNGHSTRSDEQKQPTKEERPSEQAQDDEDELDEEAILERKRLRRLAILAKYGKGSGAGTPQEIDVSAPTQTELKNKHLAAVAESEPSSTPAYSPSRRSGVQSAGTPIFPTEKDTAVAFVSKKGVDTEMSPGSTAQEPETNSFESMDDRLKAFKAQRPTAVKPAAAVTDMFALDMFSESDQQTNGAAVGAMGVEDSENPGLVDNWDDHDGYYKIRIGETIDNRYAVFAHTGRGVFSNVVRARDIKNGSEEVAIKIIRNNDIMLKAGEREVSLLQTLAEKDPDDLYHCVRLKRTFKYRGHLCLVFELLSMNLREVLKKFGSGVGLHIQAVKSYAHQLFLSLKLLHKCNFIHADIKPDNILVKETKSNLKLCDFGSATPVEENEITPFLCSRYYRPPEVMLGLKYDMAVDMWSVGCTIYELFTGKIAFRGETNNEMLKLIQDVTGRFPNKLVRKGAFKAEHYDDDMNFLYLEKDRLTKLETTRKLKVPEHPVRDLTKELLRIEGGPQNELERRFVQYLADILLRIFNPDPQKRITADEALRHPLITELYK
eukprot:Colp12_sorted_trinity150504_noHs@21190